MTISNLDGAAGKQYMYIQRIEYSLAREKKGREDCYRAVRMMFSDKKIMASATFLTLDEANDARIRSVYKNFDSFAFPDSETYMLTKDKNDIRNVAGLEIVFTAHSELPEGAKRVE